MFSNMVQINAVVFFSTIASTKGQIDHFLDGKSSPPEITSHSVVLDGYIQRMQDFQKVLETYKTLLQKDIKTIKDTGQSMVDLDNSLLTGAGL
ncbi:hypothetical protein [Listeria booriae]|uniref:hypothetical protein n=1 Tax=Listeria booriae TaxID=1552123 RepID=UPI001626C81F|nr:hypothetical protein [Listeria booriae]MBC2258106.1 YwqI/YxiC family protein [Listeria booriae]